MVASLVPQLRPGTRILSQVAALLVDCLVKAVSGAESGGWMAPGSLLHAAAAGCAMPRRLCSCC